MNCWEFTRCGREEGGAKVEELGTCPAFPDHGTDCYRVSGALCGEAGRGSFADKLARCAACDFYALAEKEGPFLLVVGQQ
ncbi:two-CW domain-containing protein [Geomesophilobacter sediminis]|uniref:Uncharacterized protein n=1 Tax=Geomesophilobacter sediminis TaxID=2798584 RepID=A0A8J7LY20_9BACT|nr:hypothetical protein [Geomesophilobacter sediminis]MBJ6724141.1 hypothetical protein [Geomesophilobacter sediminis]